jgi:phosphonate transport system substrate-binding protein
MEERLGIPVELFTGTNYTAVIEAMRANRVEAMLVGPFSYVLAVQEAQAEALAINVGLESDTPVYDPDVPAHYYSVIYTKKGSGIETLEDLRGVDFTFVDPASTSGHLAPKTLLIKNGLNPDEEMQTVFAGSHPTAVLAVWSDSAAAGATYEDNLYSLMNEGQIEFCGFEGGETAVPRTPEEIKAVYDACPDGSLAIIAYSDPIPSTPFAVRSALPDSFKAAVKQALLDTKDNAELISQTAQWYIDPSEELGLERLDQYYNSLRDIAQLLELDLQELAN